MLPLYQPDAAMPPNKRSKRLKAGSRMDSRTGTDVKAKRRVTPAQYLPTGPATHPGGVERHDRHYRTLPVPPVDRLTHSIAPPLADRHFSLLSRSSTIGSTLLAQVRRCVQYETEKWGRRPFVMDVILDLKASRDERGTLYEPTMTTAATRTQKPLIVCRNGEGDAPRAAAGAPCYHHRTYYDFTGLKSLDLSWADQSNAWGSFGTDGMGLEQRRESVISGEEDGEAEPEDNSVGESTLGGRIGNSRFPISRERSTVTQRPSQSVPL